MSVYLRNLNDQKISDFFLADFTKLEKFKEFSRLFSMPDTPEAKTYIAMIEKQYLKINACEKLFKQTGLILHDPLLLTRNKNASLFGNRRLISTTNCDAPIAGILENFTDKQSFRLILKGGLLKRVKYVTNFCIKIARAIKAETIETCTCLIPCLKEVLIKALAYLLAGDLKHLWQWLLILTSEIKL